jgi:CRP-like cAMP-binding protein
MAQQAQTAQVGTEGFAKAKQMFTATNPVACASVATINHQEVDVRTLLALLDNGPQLDGQFFSGQFFSEQLLLSERLPRRRVRAGQQLIKAREAAKAIYIVRTGAFKAETLDLNGVAQIVGFPMRGDLLGADGLSDGQYCADVYALEESDVIVLTLSRLSELAAQYPGFERIIYRCMARTLVREQNQVWALGSQCASARLAQFFKQLSEHYAQAGYSPVEFVLRMSRAELASYLGLTVETSAEP